MSSLTGLSSGFFTDINVVDTIAVDGDIGTLNQVITSDGFKTEWAAVPGHTIPLADLLTAAEFQFINLEFQFRIFLNPLNHLLK